MNNRPFAFHRPIDTQANAPGVCSVCGRNFDAPGEVVIRLDLAALTLAVHRDPCAGMLLEQLKPYVGQA